MCIAILSLLCFLAGKMWKDHNLLPQLEGLSEHINILSLQTTELNDIESLYYMALIRAT